MNIKITDVRALSGDSAFLIDDGKTSIMYDSGFAFTGTKVAEKIKKVLGERSLDYIFLTHSHYDHALGSVYALEIWPDAKVVAGEYAAKIFAKPTAKAIMRDLDGKFAKTCGVDEYVDLIDNLKVDIPVANGDVIKAGDMEFIALNLPGHTKCSVGYYCKEERLLLGCESIGVYNGEDDVIPSYLVGYKMALDSIDRVSRLDIDKILLPHFGLIDGEKAKYYLKKARESAVSTADMIVKMLKEGKDKDEIAQSFKERFYRGYVKEIYPIDAMNLNTGITINLLEKELINQGN
ncbi:MAG: MBL fold metallo-hydrolase [Monoglobales bacterium]